MGTQRQVKASVAVTSSTTSGARKEACSRGTLPKGSRSTSSQSTDRATEAVDEGAREGGVQRECSTTRLFLQCAMVVKVVGVGAFEGVWGQYAQTLKTSPRDAGNRSRIGCLLDLAVAEAEEEGRGITTSCTSSFRVSEVEEEVCEGVEVRRVSIEGP